MPSPLPPGAEAGPREGGPRPGAVDGPRPGAAGGPLAIGADGGPLIAGCGFVLACKKVL